jgi:hypothetical protein
MVPHLLIAARLPTMAPGFVQCKPWTGKLKHHLDLERSIHGQMKTNPGWVSMQQDFGMNTLLSDNFPLPGIGLNSRLTDGSNDFPTS